MNPARTRIFVALPAYNEALSLPPLMSALEETLMRMRELGCERRYFIVDDGSTDATLQVLEDMAARLPITIGRHSPNQGLGPTIRDALRMATDEAIDSDIVITMDADNTQPAGLIAPMCQKIWEGHDVVIASRYQHGARVIGLSWDRHIFSFGARVLFSTLWPIRGVRDYTCGYRAYRGAVLKQAFAFYGESFISERGFQCMVDILLRLSRFDFVFGEVPMVLRYDLKGGESAMRVGSTVLNTCKLIVRRKLERANVGEHR